MFDWPAPDPVLFILAWNVNALRVIADRMVTINDTSDVVISGFVPADSVVSALESTIRHAYEAMQSEWHSVVSKQHESRLKTKIEMMNSCFKQL